MFVRSAPHSGDFSNEVMGFGSRCKRFQSGTSGSIGGDAAEASHSRALQYKTIAAGQPVVAQAVTHLYKPTRLVAQENFSTLIGTTKHDVAGKRKAAVRMAQRPASGTGDRARFTAGGIDPTNLGPGAYQPDITDITTRPVTPQFRGSQGLPDPFAPHPHQRFADAVVSGAGTRSPAAVGGLPQPSINVATLAAPRHSPSPSPSPSLSLGNNHRPLSGSLRSNMTSATSHHQSAINKGGRPKSNSIVSIHSPAHRNSLVRGKMLSLMPSGEFDTVQIPHVEEEEESLCVTPPQQDIPHQQSSATSQSHPRLPPRPMSSQSHVSGSLVRPQSGGGGYPRAIHSSASSRQVQDIQQEEQHQNGKKGKSTSSRSPIGRPLTPTSFTHRPESSSCGAVWKLPFATKSQLKNGPPSAFALASESVTARDSFLTFMLTKNSLGMQRSQAEIRRGATGPLTYLKPEAQVKLSSNTLVLAEQGKVTAGSGMGPARGGSGNHSLKRSKKE